MKENQPMRAQIMEQLKTAMKAGDKAKVSALRLMQAAIKDRDIEVRTEGRTQITDDEMLVLFQKMVKQRQESLKMYEDAGRTGLAAQERSEIDIIQSFMPQQMSIDEIKAAIAGLIAETGAASVKDLGKIMPLIKERYTGRMDMGQASIAAKECFAKIALK